MAVVGVRGADINGIRDDIVKTESFGPREFERVNASNVNEVVDKHPGIAVQVECSICNVRNISLNNLPGRYTTMLIDGIPIFSSVSAAYGLDMIGLYGAARVDVARGAGVSLVAPEALAGVVNLVTRWPTERELSGQVQAGNFDFQRVDAYGAYPFDGGTLFVGYNYNNHLQADANGDGVSEYSGYKRNVGGLALGLNDVGGFVVRGRVDLAQEDRNGGAMGRDYDAIKNSTSGLAGFNFSQPPSGSPLAGGWLRPDGDYAAALAEGQKPVQLANGQVFLPYDSGAGGISEIIFTDRVQTTWFADRSLDEGKLHFAAAYARHDQDSFYEFDTYVASQNQYYVEASYLRTFDWAQILGGVDYRYEDLRSQGRGNGGTVVNNGFDNYTYRTPGAFLQAYQGFLDNFVEVNGSVRYDHNNEFGGIWSPRLNVLFNHSPEAASRLSYGQGFRLPTSFFEQDHGILNDTRIVRDITEPEQSLNLSYAFNYATDRWGMALSLNYNRIKNMALLIPGLPDPQNPLATYTLFTSSKNAQIFYEGDITVTYRFTPELTGSAAYEQNSYNLNLEPGAIFFARPNNRAYFTLDYDAAGWDLFARLVWTGHADLAKFYDYANTPRFNFDGTPKLSTSPTFTTLDLRAQYQANTNFKIFVGVDNVTNYRQVDVENFLWVDSAGALDVTQVWGPSRGRFFYAGISIAM